MDSKTDLVWLNSLNESEAAIEFLKCCGSQQWAKKMSAGRPFASVSELCVKAVDVWWELSKDDWLEAFRSHPKIGEKKATSQISTQAQTWSGQEQDGIENSTAETLDELAKLNREYEEKFGFIFIVCATGKSSAEMLAILRSRITNDVESELRIAAGEQVKITEIRLRKLLG
jgi:OHCU decarboxylase